MYLLLAAAATLAGLAAIISWASCLCQVRQTFQVPAVIFFFFFSQQGYYIMKVGAGLSFLAAVMSGLAAAIWPGMIQQVMQAGSEGQEDGQCRTLLHLGIFAALGDTEFYTR